MRVLLTTSVLNDRSANVYVRQILDAVVRGPHWVFADEIALDGWLIRQGETGEDLREVFDLSVRREHDAKAGVMELVVGHCEAAQDGNILHMPPEDAAKLLSIPLLVVVENSTNDQNFLLAHLNPAERRLWEQALRARWVDVRHGGGATLEQELGRLSELEVRRAWVMFDSDRMHPDEHRPDWTGERPGHRPATCQALKWEPLCRERFGDRYWMLHRRAIENYMPVSEIEVSLEEAGKPVDQARAFARLSDAQRWFFPMKKGLRHQREKNQDGWRALNLYETVTPDDLRLLNDGFQGLADGYQRAGSAPWPWDEAANTEGRRAIENLLRLL